LDTRDGIGFLHVPAMRNGEVLVEKGASMNALNNGVAGYYTDATEGTALTEPAGQVAFDVESPGPPVNREPGLSVWLTEDLAAGAAEEVGAAVVPAVVAAASGGDQVHRGALVDRAARGRVRVDDDGVVVLGTLDVAHLQTSLP